MSVNHAKRFGPMKNDIRQQQYRHDYRQQQMLARNRFYRSSIIFAPAETTSISTAAAVHQQYIYSRFHRPLFESAATTSISAAAAVHQQYSSFHDQVNSMHQQQLHQFQQQQQFRAAASTMKLTALIASDRSLFNSFIHTDIHTEAKSFMMIMMFYFVFLGQK